MHGYKWPINCTRIAALYTVFNALEGATTDDEKMYAVFSELVVGFIFGALAGVMTQIMASLKGTVCFHIIRHLETMHD